MDSEKFIVLGSLFGYATFLLSLFTMEGILTRPDQQGEYKYTFQNFYEYMKLPFSINKFPLIWGIHPKLKFIDRIKMLNLNWVFMTTLGAFCGYGLSELTNSIQ